MNSRDYFRKRTAQILAHLSCRTRKPVYDHFRTKVSERFASHDQLLAYK